MSCPHFAGIGAADHNPAQHVAKPTLVPAPGAENRAPLTAIRAVQSQRPVRHQGDLKDVTQLDASHANPAEEAASNLYDSVSNAAPERGVPSAPSQSSKRSARKSLFSTPEPACPGQGLGSPNRGPAALISPGVGHISTRAGHLSTPQQAPTPTYISRSQQQESAAADNGAVDSRRTAVQASPAVSEMVYELRPPPAAAARGNRFSAPLKDELEGYARSNAASPLRPDLAAAPDSHLEHDDLAHQMDKQWKMRGAEASPAQQQSGGHASGERVSARHSSSREGAASSLPEYSGFSSEMRAAAKATAEALLADASWQGDSAQFQAALSAAGHSSGNMGQERGVLGNNQSSPDAEAPHIDEGHHDSSPREQLMSVDELEAQIQALNVALEAEEGTLPAWLMVDFSQPKVRRTQQNLAACFGLGHPAK